MRFTDIFIKRPVLATVVSTAVPNQAVIDAGAKALGREPMRGSSGEGFGCLLQDPAVVVKSMSEEHGILDLSRSTWRPRVGDRVPERDRPEAPRRSPRRDLRAGPRARAADATADAGRPRARRRGARNYTATVVPRLPRCTNLQIP